MNKCIYIKTLRELQWLRYDSDDMRIFFGNKELGFCIFYGNGRICNTVEEKEMDKENQLFITRSLAKIKKKKKKKHNRKARQRRDEKGLEGTHIATFQHLLWCEARRFLPLPWGVSSFGGRERREAQVSRTNP